MRKIQKATKLVAFYKPTRKASNLLAFLRTTKKATNLVTFLRCPQYLLLFRGSITYTTRQLYCTTAIRLGYL
jgi:hypothetical protein